MGVDPHGKGQFWELSGPFKSIGSLCCGVGNKLDHSGVNNGMQQKAYSVLNNDAKCDSTFCQNLLTTF